MGGSVDRVVVTNGNDKQVYTVEEFVALPLAARVTFILNDSVRFFVGTAPVPTSRALRWLRHRNKSAP